MTAAIWQNAMDAKPKTSPMLIVTSPIVRASIGRMAQFGADCKWVVSRLAARFGEAKS